MEGLRCVHPMPLLLKVGHGGSRKILSSESRQVVEKRLFENVLIYLSSKYCVPITSLLPDKVHCVEEEGFLAVGIIVVKPGGRQSYQ